MNAAAPCDAAEPSPAHMHAAINLRSQVRGVPGKPQTPGSTCSSRPPAVRRFSADELRPAARAWARVINPCWSRAMTPRRTSLSRAGRAHIGRLKGERVRCSVARATSAAPAHVDWEFGYRPPVYNAARWRGRVVLGVRISTPFVQVGGSRGRVGLGVRISTPCVQLGGGRCGPWVTAWSTGAPCAPS